MLFVSGLDKKYMVVAIAIIVIAAPYVVNHLPAHAKARIEIFQNPESDPRGMGYNLIQSKLAIGAGQFLGMGVLKGNQTQLGYLSPKTTDFIYSVIGEEMGFVVSSTIVVLYVILITKAIGIGKNAEDSIGSYIASRNRWNFIFPYDRKYRNDNWAFTDNSVFHFHLLVMVVAR